MSRLVFLLLLVLLLHRSQRYRFSRLYTIRRIGCSRLIGVPLNDEQLILGTRTECVEVPNYPCLLTPANPRDLNRGTSRSDDGKAAVERTPANDAESLV